MESAGLRVLMKLGKDTGIVPSIVNTSDEVYNIFETTGFTEMFDVFLFKSQTMAYDLDSETLNT